ncbi:putative mechanosensitive ion channel MscS, LSM domain-containing protein [Rosa chinensis]|uniref:Mechanosensitive ion channel protein n=1 Tax=Rosa chinensis TaxID=74649 RepID=A0A2P6PZF5_ROSCH|nr:mechanosensitive ion channel protein 8 [Rosa chinensis]PRQ27289.1 putative mechanosensitive ion channel MscS, LSM domain-containing protein [Rosa chinensis]
MAERPEQVEVKVDGTGERSPRNTVGGESFRRRSKDQAAPNSGGPQVLRCSSSASFSSKGWKPPMSKTRSRLIDPLEERCPKSDRLAHSGRLVGKDEEDDGFDVDDIPEEYKRMKFNTLTLLQWVSLVCVLGALVCNLWIPMIRRLRPWDLPIWKWELLVLALICGRLVSGWGIRVVVFFVERNFLMRKRVLYFVYGLRKAVQNCLWLGLVLVVWHLIFDKKVEKETKSRILPYVTRTLVCFLVATLIWLVKTLLVKVLALSFHVNAFFERIREALFNQYVIETLSGPPLFHRQQIQEEEEKEKAAAEIREFQKAGACMPRELRVTLLSRNGPVVGSGGLQSSPTIGRSPRFSSTPTTPKSVKQDEEIPVNHLNKLNQKNVSAWNMRRMMNIIRHGSLTTLDEQILDVEDDSSVEIKTECQAKEAARKIFLKVAKPGAKSIFLDDLMLFMNKDEALKTIVIFGAASEHDGISKSSLKHWMVRAFRERRALSLSLNDTKTAVDELHNLLNILVGVIIVITWLIILGIPITHFLVFISSQILLVVFIFGNTCKTVFEAIIFLFVMHPYDVGDRCEVDGVQLVVEEMNLLTTVFLKFDNQKVIYPNSVLATKPIANYYRSPDMGDAVDFCVHISTPLEKLNIVKERIIGYIETRTDHWHPAPMVVLRDVEELNKLKISVWLTHKMNHQDMVERWSRRALLIEAMVKVFKELDIQYRLLPIDVNVRNMPSLTSKPPSNWTACAP